MKEQKEILKGVMIPDSYLNLECELLESMKRLQEAKKSYRTARNKLVAMMNRDNVQRIESNLATIYMFPAPNGRAKRLRVVPK